MKTMDADRFTRGIPRDQIDTRTYGRHTAAATRTRKLSFNAVLAIIAAVLAVAIVFGTAAALANNKTLESDYRRADPSPQKVVNMSGKKQDKLAAFTSIGEIRTITKRPEDASNGTVMVVSPWFSYPDGDVALYEELMHKSRQLRALFIEFFGSHTEQELRSMGEQAVKAQLKELVNAELVIGSITEVYFDDYLFFD